MARTAPGEVKARLPAAPPASPESFDDILRDLDDIVVPGLSHWSHPSFFGYFPCNGELSSVLGDFASTGLGVLGLAWQSSPALTEVEEVATDWLRQLLGLSPAWSGVIQDTASTSTLVALMCARERASNYGLARGGLQAIASPLVVYTSAHSHSSVEKAALLAGFGRDHLRFIPFDGEYAMRADALEEAVAADRAANRVPCAVVGTTGTTTSTAVDPIAEIAAIAETAWAVAARGCRDGRLGNDSARVPLDVERHRGRRLDRRQSPQVAGRGVRLFGVLRAQGRKNSYA